MGKRKRGARRLRRLLAGGMVGAVAMVGLTAAPALAADAAPVGTLMAKLGTTTTEAQAAAVGERSGLTHVSTLEEIGWAAYEYTGDRAWAHDALRSDPAVFRIDFTRLGERLELNYQPRDELVGNSQLTLTDPLTGQPGLALDWHWAKPNFFAAWDRSKGTGVKVAVIDSEFDTTHPDLAAKLGGTPRNFDSGTPQYGGSDVRSVALNDFHGSHVAGLVGAQTDNGVGVAGACFDCQLLLYKVGTSGVVGGAPNVDDKFVRDLAEALRAVGDSDAAVVNMSLGTRRDHAPLADAIAYVRSKGKVIVAAAANDQDKPGLAFANHYPAAYDGVIAVASTRSNDSISPFSSQGNYVDIAAPGEVVLSTTDSRDPVGAVVSGAQYKAISGTSMASPIVAGLAGLMKSVRPDLTPEEVEAIMKSTADKMGSAQAYGAGRINALRAVEGAQAYVRPVPPPPPAPPAPPPPPPAPPAPPVIVKTALKKVSYSCKVGRVKVPAARSAFKRLKRNSTLVCTGRVIPAKAGLKLKVERRGKGKWARVSQVKTNKKGRFVYRTKLRATGKLQYRFKFTGSATLKKKTSPVVRVNVAKAPRRR